MNISRSNLSTSYRFRLSPGERKLLSTLAEKLYHSRINLLRLLIRQAAQRIDIRIQPDESADNPSTLDE